MHKSLIPIAFSTKNSFAGGQHSCWLPDVGGTKTALALFELREGQLTRVREAVFSSQEFGSFAEIVRQFNGTAPLPSRLSIAFAGPVQGGKAIATNLGWSIDATALSRELGMEEVFLINDLEAAGYGLAALTEKDFITVYPGQPPATGNAGILSPGTGLGEAGLFWDGSALHPFATEGGHSDFAPRNAFDWALQQYLQQQFGRVSWERVISGPGIHQIFCFLRDVQRREVPKWVQEEMKTGDPAAAISLGAQQDCAICEETQRLFVQYLSVEAANLALKLKATGGIFLGGGILPKIWNEGLQAVFLEHFFEVGRLRPLLESVPVYLVGNQQMALLGAAYFAR